MNNSRESFDDACPGCEDLEKIIRASRNYVVPSNDLRPRVLDGARELEKDRNQTRRLGKMTLAGFALWALSFGFVNSVDEFRESWVAPAGDDLQRIAIELAAKSNTSPEWGLVEAFSMMRSLRNQDIDSNLSNQRKTN